MAQRIKKIFEVTLGFLILMVFVIVVNKYYHLDEQGEKIRKELQKISEENAKKENYAKYKNEVSKLELNVDKQKQENNATSIPVLVYHGIVTENLKGEDVQFEKFKAQMYALKQNGYETIKLDDFYQFINNHKQLPEKSFLLTFDDGRKDSYYPVDPVLAALDYSAVMFVITNNLISNKKSPYYLSPDEIRVMLTTGRWEIQSHGRDDHGFVVLDSEKKLGRFMSNKKWLTDENQLENDEQYRERISNDLLNSKEDLKNLFGVDATGYALPAGDYGHRASNFLEAEDVISDVIEQYYPMSFYQFNPDIRFGYFRSNFQKFSDHQFFFRRIEVTDKFDTKDLLDNLNASREKKLPFEEDFSNGKNWIKGWGNYQLIENSLKLNNVPGEDGVGIFMDGTLFLTDYQYTAKLKLEKGLGYTLLARVVNGYNLVGCDFSKNVVKIFEFNNGKTIILKNVSLKHFDISLAEFKVGIKVDGRKISCLVGDNFVSDGMLDKNQSLFGGVGIKARGESKNSEVELVARDISIIQN